MKDQLDHIANVGKFADPDLTADGQVRARVGLTNPRTLWFNTGTLCNITCANCYIESSPQNDALAYLTVADVRDYLQQLIARRWNVSEIGFTGGEPFMNPDMIEMARLALVQGYRALILTNAMRPMTRKTMRDGLAALGREFGDKLVLRVSLDHWSEPLHDTERGRGTFANTLAGMTWLRDQRIKMDVAGRTMWGEPEDRVRQGYAALFAQHGFDIDASDPARLVLFPEMDETVEVPEITEDCWDILHKSPEEVMCSSSRMVIRRKGAAAASVVACTLLPYDLQFELGHTLAEAEGEVALNHPHCAKFCVLGGASCSA